MTTTSDNSEVLLYTGWTRPHSTGLFGMSWGTTLICGALVITALLTMLFAGPAAGFTVLILSALGSAPLVWQREGRSGYEVTILRWQYRKARRRGETIYRSGLFSEVPGGKTKLPGILAPTKLYEAEDLAGWRFGMIHLPAKHAYTVVLRAWPSGDEQVDRSVINNWVAEWGVALASMGQTSDVIGVVPVIETIPETGNRTLREVERMTDPSAPLLAKEVVYEAAEMEADDEPRLECRLAVTFKATTDARRKDPAEQAVEIGRRLPGLCVAMEAAGVAVRPMPADDVIAFVRRSTDPAAQLNLELAEMTTDGHGLDWSDAGPVSHDAMFDHYVHDGARSVTWEMELPPAGAVDEAVLYRLLAPNADVPRKRVAIVYRPHTAADSVKIVDDDFKNALAAEQSGRGLVSAAAQIRVEATGRARDEQARGHGLVRFGLLITITEPRDADLPAIDAIIKDLSVQSRLRIRRCYRFQDAAFYASLGIGVLLPDWASIPKTLAG